MKKIVMLVVSILTFSLATQAQQYSRFSIIPKGGITSSNVDFDTDLTGQKSNLGFVAGAGVNVPITADGFISVQPELLYIQKGYKATVANIEQKNVYNYLELPLLLKVNFGTEAIRAFVNGGPSFGYLANGKVKNGDNDTDANFTSDDTNRWDLGLQFGGGVGIGAGPGDILLDVRYGIGLTDRKKGDNLPDSQLKSKNRVIGVMLGYAIPLGGR